MRNSVDSAILAVANLYIVDFRPLEYFLKCFFVGLCFNYVLSEESQMYLEFFFRDCSLGSFFMLILDASLDSDKGGSPL